MHEKPEEHKEIEVIKATHDPIKDWRMDPKGYFLIRIDRKNELIEIGLCKKGNVILKKIVGKTAEDIGYTVVREKITEHPQHLVYLGKELEKAEIALKLGIEYVQDTRLKVDDDKSVVRKL